LVADVRKGTKVSKLLSEVVKRCPSPMSRGLGKTQRFVLDYLAGDDYGASAVQIADAYADRSGRPLQRSQRESIKRAIHGLESVGLVETVYSFSPFGAVGGYGEEVERLWVRLK
jgi:hypothetical protein